MSGRWIRKFAAGLLLAAAGMGTIVSRVQAQTGPAASVISMMGQVSVLHGSEPWALRTGDMVQPRQVIITGPDGFADFRVADGSHFQVFPNSRIVFRENPPSWKDLLEVLIGRVKVQIQKLGNQPNPNNVHTPTAVISVRGTEFDVAVEDDETTFVSVDEGLVEVRNITSPGPSKILGPGESVRVFKNQPLARTIDKGSAAQQAMRAAAQALYEVLYRTSRGSPSGGTGGATPTPPAQGDKPKDPPPPSTAPPAPPAAP